MYHIVIQGIFNTFLYFTIEENFKPLTIKSARIDLNHLWQYNPNNVANTPIPTTRSLHIPSTYDPPLPPSRNSYI